MITAKFYNAEKITNYLLININKNNNRIFLTLANFSVAESYWEL